MSLQPPVEGRFIAGGFAGLLRSFNAAAAAGRLDVAAERAACALFLNGGKVDAIAADEERFKLGSWLSARGAVEPGRVALALLKQPPDVPFGEFLVRDRAIDGSRLAEELQLRAAAMIGLLLFTAGTYRFREGEAPTGGRSVAMSLDPTALLLAAARGADDSRLAVVAANGGARLKVDAEALESARGALLSPQEAFLLSRIDGKVTPEGLRHLVPMSEPDVSRALGVLILAGLAELAAGGEAPAADVRAHAGAPEHDPAPTRPPQEPSELEDRQRRDVHRLAHDIGSRDYYRRLGLSRGATQDQVHQRFREMSLLYATDQAGPQRQPTLRTDLEKIQTALVEAYRTLTDPQQRSKYDDFLRSGGQSDGGSGEFQARDRQASARRQLVEANQKRVKELVRLGQYGEAIQLLEQAARLDPQPETLLELARLELRNPMWSQRALDRLRLALSIDARFTDGWIELATFWGKRKKKDRQRECLRRILEYDPENVQVQRALIDIGVV